MKCPNCNEQTEPDEMSRYKGEVMCEGCCESRYMFEYTDDPHGRDWG